MMTETDKIPCSQCSNLTSSFHADNFSGLCGNCYSEKRKVENKEDEESAKRMSKESMNLRMERWEILCPDLYRKSPTDFIDPVKFRDIVSYKTGPIGLMIVGPSRVGKTTSVWNLLHKLYVLEGKTFKAISEPEFTIERDKYSRNGNLETFLNTCIRSDIFFLDDLGHAATNARNLEELYHVIEKRTSWKKPIIVTSQFTRDELSNKGNKTGSYKTALAIMNRISSFCRFVQF